MANRVLILATLVFAGLYFYLTMYHIRVRDFGDPVGPRMFPFLLFGGLLLSCAMMAWEMFTKKEGAEDGIEERGQHTLPLVVAIIAAGAVVYVAIFQSVGFVLSTALYLLAFTTYFNRGKHVANIGTSVLMPVATFLLFKGVLGVDLPSGFLPF